MSRLVRRLLRLGPPPDRKIALSPVVVELRDYQRASARRQIEQRARRNETGNLLEFVTLGGPYRRERA